MRDKKNHKPDEPGRDRPTGYRGPRTPDARAYTVRAFLVALLLFSLYLGFLLYRPFIHIIILSILASSLAQGTQTRLTDLYRGRRNAAALTVTVLLTVIIVLPVTAFFAAMAVEGVRTLGDINDWLRQGNMQDLMSHPLLETGLEWLRRQLGQLGVQEVDIQQQVMGATRNLARSMASQGANLLGNTASLVLKFFLWVFVTFYLVRDGRVMVDGIKGLVPLAAWQQDVIITKVRAVGRSVVVGGLLVAVAQGVVGGVGLALAGIPALFWGAVMGLSSFVPVLGTALVWGPASAWLFIAGDWKRGIFLLVWSALVVSSIDTFLRPWLMKGAARMSLLFVFLSILGGLRWYGPLGVLYGPLIVAFAKVMIDLYGSEYGHWLTSRAPPEDRE